MGVDRPEQVLVGEDSALKRTQAIPVGVGIGAADGNHLPAAAQEAIPQGQRFGQGTGDEQTGKESGQDGNRLAGEIALELRHVIPQLDAGEAIYLPIQPGDLRFIV